MKTTLIIDDQVMRRLKQEAARQRRSVSDLVEAALRLLLEKPGNALPALPRLPLFHGGPSRVDIADRDALYQAMEGR